MSSSESTRDGLAGVRPDTEASVGSTGGRPGQPAADAAVASSGGAGAGAPQSDGGRRGGRRGRRGDPHAMVPPAHFQSYYGRPVVKPSPWTNDIPAYLFLGGLAAGSSLLGAGADLTGRPVLRRAGRVTAIGAISGSFVALVHDLGRPERFLHMLRVAKPTSPMSMGTWILSAYSPFCGLAAVSEAAGLLPSSGVPGLARRLAPSAGRAAGLVAATIAPLVATYTAVLVADTASPAWHEVHRELPFVFAGSASAAAAGMGLLAAPLSESGPAQSLAVVGALVELGVGAHMERRLGVVGEAYQKGTAGWLMRAARALTVVGAGLAATAGRRNRVAAAVGGLALLSGSACLRFGVFEAGQASAKDPRYTVIPQRERMAARQAAADGA